MELDGKTALVTGGGSGLGRAAALELARQGARVAVLSRTRDEIDAVVDDIRDLGGQGFAVEGDISSKESQRAAYAQVAAQFGQLDILFANAGINGTWAPIEELSPEEWDKTNAVNLRGTFLSVHHAIPLMKQRGGAIVITSSINGTRTFTTAGACAYATTKAGQLAFGQMAALELAQYGIRVNVICPGAIESEIDENTNQRDVTLADVPAHYPEGQIPLTGGAKGKAEQVADLVAFLVSDRASHITGTPVWIDGAQSLLV